MNYSYYHDTHKNYYSWHKIRQPYLYRDSDVKMRTRPVRRRGKSTQKANRGNMWSVRRSQSVRQISHAPEKKCETATSHGANINTPLLRSRCCQLTTLVAFLFETTKTKTNGRGGVSRHDEITIRYINIRSLVKGSKT